jgi:AbiTii
VAHPDPDPLDRLEKLVLDRTTLLSDVLRVVVMLADRTNASELRTWALNELSGYPGLSVPEYRRVKARIIEQIQVFSAPMNRPFNVHSVPEEVREYFTDVVPLNQGVDTLEYLVNECEAQHRQIDLQHYASDPYAAMWNKNPRRAYTVLALYWTLSPAVVRGVIGEIRSRVAALVSDLRADVSTNDGLPSAEQAEQALRNIVGKATFNGPVNFFTGHTKTGDIVSNQPQNEYNFGDIKGNVAAGSQNFTQVNQDTFDVAKVREFADLITEIAGTLQLEADQRSDLEAGAIELHAAAVDPAADKGRMRRALNAIMAPLKLAANTALRNTAIAAGTTLGNDLDAAIHHLPHL